MTPDDWEALGRWANVAEFAGLLLTGVAAWFAARSRRAAEDARNQVHGMLEQLARVDHAAEVKGIIDALDNLKLHHMTLPQTHWAGLLVLYSAVNQQVARVKGLIVPSAEDSALLDGLYGQIVVMYGAVARFLGGGPMPDFDRMNKILANHVLALARVREELRRSARNDERIVR